MGGTLDLDTIYCLSNQVKFVVEAETLCSRTFFFYDFFTSTAPCDQIFALRQGSTLAVARWPGATRN